MTRNKPLRAIGHVLRGLHLAASLAKGLQQISRLPQGGGRMRPPTPPPAPRIRP